MVLAAPWYLAMAHRHGEAFVGRFFGTENVGKFHFPWTVKGELGLLLALPILLLPWTPLIRVRGPGAALAWPWVLGLLLVYSLPGLKHPHYVLPALAPLAVLASGVQPGPRRLGSAAVLLALAVAGALALRFPLAAPVRLGLGCAVVLLALSAVAVGRGAVLAGTVGFAGAAVLLFASVLPGALPPPVPSWVRSGRGRARCSPRPRTRASTPSWWESPCTGRPGRPGCSVRSRRGRRSWSPGRSGPCCPRR